VFEPVSAKNPLFGDLRRLSRRRSARLEQGRFLIEGRTLIEVALDAGAHVTSVLHDGGRPLDEADAAIGARAAAAGARLIEVPDGIMGRIVDTVTPQPLAAVVDRHPTTLESVLADGSPTLPVLVLVDVSDPGNAGTLLRSAEAAGVAAVVFCSGSVDPFNPKTVRSSAGSVFLVPIVEGVAPTIALAALGDAGVRRVGTVARGGTALDQAALDGPVAIVLGSEAHGLPEGLSAGLDELVTITMSGRAESLNVAMAGTLVVFEAARQRRHPTD
jgi:RNA methyltransferase, TrmH family